MTTTPTPEELAPCPFCGAAQIETFMPCVNDIIQMPAHVQCSGCGVIADLDKWNRRVSTPQSPSAEAREYSDWLERFAR